MTLLLQRIQKTGTRIIETLGKISWCWVDSKISQEEVLSSECSNGHIAQCQTSIGKPQAQRIESVVSNIVWPIIVWKIDLVSEFEYPLILPGARLVHIVRDATIQVT